MNTNQMDSLSDISNSSDEDEILKLNKKLQIESKEIVLKNLKNYRWYALEYNFEE